MPREDWFFGRRPPREPDEERPARWPDAEREDFGQADYSRDYGYDPEHRRGYHLAEHEHRDDPEQRRAFRRHGDEDPDYARRMDSGDYRSGEVERRSWGERARGFFGGPSREEDDRRRRGPSDRVLWAVIAERLDDERGLDLRDVEVLVEDAEVTLNGTVRRKEDKRRIEDIADVRGVRHVQNNLRVRDHRGWF